MFKTSHSLGSFESWQAATIMGKAAGQKSRIAVSEGRRGRPPGGQAQQAPDLVDQSASSVAASAESTKQRKSGTSTIVTNSVIKEINSNIYKDVIDAKPAMQLSRVVQVALFPR